MESVKKSKYIFEFILDEEQLKSLVQLDNQILMEFVRRCAKYYLKILDNNAKQVFTYLANQKNIMQLHSTIKADALSVNLALHFALMFSEYLIRQHRSSQAKNILKQTEDYAELANQDTMMQAICLNNLSILFKKRLKWKRGLESSLKGVGIIEPHLEDLYKGRRSKRIIEDGVIYVNLLAIAQSCLKELINRQSKTQIAVYKQLLRIVARMGFKFALKYYGQNSYFAKKFDYCQSKMLNLPVISDESSSQEQPEESQFEKKMAAELMKLYEILKNLKVEPQVFYINVIEKNKQVVEQIVQEVKQVEQVSPYKQEDILFLDKLGIDNWQAQVSFYRQNQFAQFSVELSYPNIYSLNFKLQRQNKKSNVFISRQNMNKILRLINYYDVLPYESSIGTFQKKEFVRKFLIYFMKVNQDGEMRISPKAISIIDPFQHTFMNLPCLIFINHIRFRRFRIAISLLTSSEPFYFDIEFKQKDYNYIYDLQEIESPFINSKCNHFYPQEENEPSSYNFSPLKKVVLVSPERFREKIVNILKILEIFLKEQEEGDLSQLTSAYDLAKNYSVNYFHYIEFEENIGQVYLIKHKINSNHIEINIKNTFKTHSIGKIKEEARGNILYSPEQFYKDFGIHLKHTLKYILAFFEIILQKYFIKIYQNPLLPQQQNAFDLNSIAELPFISKCFSRKFILFENYYIPITIELISLSGQMPIGVRISAYEPIKGTHSGLFIHIVPQYWEKPPPKIKPVINVDEKFSEKLKKTTNDYNFKKNYFLASWLEQEGFKIIFKYITILNRSLQIKGIGSKFILLDQILALN